MEKTNLKYTLSAQTKAGIDNLKRLNLTTELGMNLGIDELRPFSGLAVSGHAPTSKDGLRLNYAAMDDDFRQKSISEILSFIEMVRQFPRLETVIMHSVPKQWLDENQVEVQYGDYNRMIDGIRQIADCAEKWGTKIALENSNAYFTGISDDVPADQIDWSGRNQDFGASSEEWIQICEDVARPNVALCLDSSHTCTYAHTFADSDQRMKVVMGYLAKPELIKHVHWNDNYLYDVRGRVDSHAILGKGSLPIEMHQVIKGLDATIIIEHFYTIQELEEELEYIDGL